MEFDWTTYVLELLNFLVLLWLLKHFFYRPVLSALDARQKGVRDQQEKAQAATAKAEAAQAEYEARLHSWQAEREQARQGLERELALERTRQLDLLKQTLAEERAKAEARAEARRQQAEAQLLRQASAQAFADAATLLGRLATPALTARIAEIAADDLLTLPSEQQSAIRAAAAALAPGTPVEVAVAHQLDAATAQVLKSALERAAGAPLTLRMSDRPDLIAGVRIALGERLLQANLADELAFFRNAGPLPTRETHA